MAEKAVKVCGNIDVKLDTKKIFVYGHSLGGATSAQVAFDDDRVLGGLNFNGTLFGSVKEVGLDKPFFLVGAEAPENPTSYFGGFIDKSWSKDAHYYRRNEAPDIFRPATGPFTEPMTSLQSWSL
ncbi:hypothetical protein FSARC_10503 [Fusarium sarcochroum]|uniref:1-alkyl-2-acetylglycerophosphocholine esterase n=1 Tax=Fusarium sarcochroum TaxID=1208366 RepID=A0A8H4TLU9_9HYPO|nr:hypothetical protein FSARC_10503 [Fusarium sarcochroum]